MKVFNPRFPKIPIHINANKYKINWSAPGRRSNFETIVKNFLQQYWQNHFVCEELPIPKSGRLKFDFFNVTEGVAIEVQGKQHDEFIKGYFHKSRSDYLRQIKRDYFKEEFCQLNGFPLWKIYPDDLPLTREFFKVNFDYSF